MENTDNILKGVQAKLGLKESFIPADNGTRSKVYLSNTHAVKISRNLAAIEGEAKILSSFNFSFIPKIKNSIKINKYGVLIESRLPGVSIDRAWKNLKKRKKVLTIQKLVQAIQLIHNQKKEYFWQAQNPNLIFSSYSDLLVHRIEKAKERIKTNRAAKTLYNSLSKSLIEKNLQKTFQRIQPSIVHGDLIMHNLLISNDGHLTGVLDWEFAQYGDVFYDLARVIYYQECAKAYADSGKDEIFEYDFTGRLIKEMKKTIKFERNKYEILRKLFLTEALAWAVDSKNPKSNISELRKQFFSTN
ncbi:MAG: hypothetical protein COU10_01600 [Candidatus Harrisonbacteria bacterium CG10_big_fil_rev_8_21_14_0_10_45_28]|uniref:Aminoglycoside phosphotransferase domain-containing protein n=1 Tax=Candidatus Harrisonbacteria bacterium CG10_big_fil_rev_8_21_14_0_10_45_28 TaxID=1974586 RepID=A0A2H0UNJ4_9BACT|nr:MAG: hypothetical protein COU10_01600 [Candidatus Harrisonbacteria bacterium CG10_big_fil_rev_8_21_14_0_10_45_28]